MTPKKAVRFEKSYAEELLRIAAGDLASARTLHAGSGGRPENVVFHAQQVMGKSLMAVLVHLGIGVPMVHDLGVLLASLPEATRPQRGFELIDFNDYAAIHRYREGRAILESSDIDTAIAVACEVLTWATQTIGVASPQKK